VQLKKAFKALDGHRDVEFCDSVCVEFCAELVVHRTGRCAQN